MEKQEPSINEVTASRQPAALQQPFRRHPRERLVLTLAIFLSLVVFGVLRYFGYQNHFEGHLPGPELGDDNPQNPWAKITPSTELEWHPCYQYVNPSFRCARLTVARDDEGNTNSDSPKVHIALVLLPAKNATTALEKPRSPLLINPGGPGGSGTLAGLLMGPALQAILGDDQPVIGFDPRGIGFTSPVADCWATPPACDGCPEDGAKGLLHRVEWVNMVSAYGAVNSSNSALRYLDAGHRAVNKLCADKDASLGSQSILTHVSTPFVATDMLSIVDAWERWVDADAASRNIVSAEPNPTKGQLVYWGFSYGTYLGATFASMYPDRVGRLVLDGVVDAELYVKPIWKESLYDADKVLAGFFRSCAEAGPSCALYRRGDGADDVRNRYYRVLADLDDYPITFTHPEFFFPVMLTADKIKQLVFSILYSPVRGFPLLATFLDLLARGQAEGLAPLVQDIEIMCKIGDLSIASLVNDAQRAIMCGDKTKPVNLKPGQIRSRYESMAEVSEFADIWVTLLLQCDGWDIYPSQSSTSKKQKPWTKPDNKTETAFPILFLSNTHDPVTPLLAAVKMALRFPGAGLLEQRAAGHCTVSAASRCTARAVRDYILRGKVPPAPVVEGDDYLSGRWTVCEADERPFQARTREFADGEDEKLVAAFEEIGHVMERVTRWGGMAAEALSRGREVVGFNHVGLWSRPGEVMPL